MMSSIIYVILEKNSTIRRAAPQFRRIPRPGKSDSVYSRHVHANQPISAQKTKLTTIRKLS